MPIASKLQENSPRRLADWFRTRAGRDLLKAENDLLAQALPELFGYHLLTLGDVDYQSGLSVSSIGHKAVVQAPAGHRLEACNVLGDYSDFPILRDSVDIVVLPHILEYSLQPHAVLREAERVLHPDGHIIIIGFNPLSCYGIGRALLGFRGHMPWQGHFYHPVRIRDWLQLLGFAIQRIEFTAFLPPVQHAGMASKVTFLEEAGKGFLAPLGGVYMIIARNLTITPNVIKPRWEKKRPVLNGVVEPTTRIRQKHE